jgi:hypothetical protein
MAVKRVSIDLESGTHIELPEQADVSFQALRSGKYSITFQSGELKLSGMIKPAERVSGRLSTTILPVEDESQGEIYQRVKAKCQQFQELHSVTVTEDAQFLIGTVLKSVLSDPHPVWNAEQVQLQKVTDDFVEKIPQYLQEIAERLSENQGISTFDVIFWLSENLASICPFLCKGPF